MASSSYAPYKVFISHAGEDKPTMAIPLHDKLSEQGITAFVDEISMRGGSWSEPAMIAAMETADIAVVIMSPEFVARKWPMKELLCFLRRSEKEPLDDGKRPPIIIPLFYRLSIQELYDEPRLDRLDRNGKSLYRASRFFERMENGEPEANIANIKTTLGKLHGAMGVENYVDASNESTNVMLKRRNVLLNDLCEQVRNAVATISEEIPPDPSDSRMDCFQKWYHKGDTVADLVLDFREGNDDRNGKPMEASVLQAVLDRSENKRVISIQGMGGVGKTSILRGLSSLGAAKQRFRDGTHFISVGVDSTPDRLIDALCKTVQASGGTQVTEKMRSEKEWKDVFNGFRSWFAEKECLFMVDDVWETSEITSGMIHELLKLHLSGMNSKIIITTRSMEIASRAEEHFVLLPREPQESQCRAILMLHSDTNVDETNSENKKAVSDILEKCSGLPLFLKLAGRAIKTLSLRPGSTGSAAYWLYSQTLDVNMQGLLNMNVDSYDRLASSLSLSVDLLEYRKDRWGFSVRLSPAEMYRRLCVLESHSLVPMTMLRVLWELRSEAEAIVLAREFEQIALATMCVKETDSGYIVQLGIHDSLHEYASEETRKHGEETVGHKIVVEGYGRQLEIDEGCRAWWSEGVAADGYVHSKICRHLASAGMKDELISLLLKPQWTIRLIEICGIHDLERSYSLGVRELKKLENEAGAVRGERETQERVSAVGWALEMVCGATKLSVGYRNGSRRELCFQLYGRLKIYEEDNAVLKDYLTRIEENGEKMCGVWLRCITPFMTPPGGRMIKLRKVSGSVRSISTSDDGNTVYCGSSDGYIIAVDARSGNVVNKWRHGGRDWVLGYAPSRSNPVSSIALSDHGNLLCSATTDGTVKVWDTKADCVLSSTVVVWGEDSDHGIAIGKGKLGISLYDGRMRLIDLKDGRLLKDMFSARRGFIHCMVFLLDGEHVVCGGEDKRLEIWNTSGEQIGEAFVGHSGGVTCVSVMPNGRHIVSGSDDCTVRLWNISRRTQVGKPFEGHSGSIRSVAISADGRRMVSLALDDTIRVWNVASGTGVCYRFGGHARFITAVVFHTTYDTVISCSTDGTVRFWDLSKSSTELNLDRHLDRHEAAVTVVAFTSSGSYAVSGSCDHSLRIWDANSGLQVGDPLLGHSQLITDVAITPDDQRVVSTSRDETVRVWDLGSQELLHTFTGHLDRINSVALTPSGGQAVTCSSDNSVRVWDLSGEEGGHFILNSACPESLAFISSRSLEKGAEQFFDQYSEVFVTDDGLRVVSRFGVMISFKVIIWNLETREVVNAITIESNADPPPYWKSSRNAIMEAVGESTQESVARTVRLKQFHFLGFDDEIWHHSNVLLGTLEKRSATWECSPDNRTLCVGLDDGHVVFMKLEGGDSTSEPLI